MIEALRADNGKLLRKLLRTLSRSEKPHARDFADLLVHHPNLQDLVPTERGCLLPITVILGSRRNLWDPLRRGTPDIPQKVPRMMGYSGVCGRGGSGSRGLSCCHTA